MKIALVVGHSKLSQGAANINQNITEWKYNKQLAEDIGNKLKHNWCIIYRDDVKNGYNKLPSKVNAWDPDIVLSLHCNAFNGKTKGHEVLYWNTSKKGLELATRLNKAIHRCLDTNDRGVKPKYDGDRGALILKSTKAPCVILEPFFIDNDIDYLNAVSKDLAQYIADELNSI